MRRGPRGAGAGGGLLFVGVLAFVGLLAARAASGPGRIAVVIGTVVLVAALTVRVVRSR